MEITKNMYLLAKEIVKEYESQDVYETLRNGSTIKVFSKDSNLFDYDKQLQGHWIEEATEITPEMASKIKNRKNSINLVPKDAIKAAFSSRKLYEEYLEELQDIKKANDIKNIKVNGAIIVTPEKVFSEEIENCFKACLKHFEFHLLPKDKDCFKWKETIDKLHRIDKIPYDMIVQIVQWARNDAFWSKNFLSLRKLRNKDKNGTMYVVVFSEKMKSLNKPSKSENTLNAMNDMLKKLEE